MDIKTLGRFEIIDEIGVGGMGLVFKGKDPRINRLVALKVVRPTLGTRSREQQQKATDRFYVEAQAAGQLSHPNIVTIYDVGEEESSEGSMVYIAMEFLDGRGLDWHIQHKTFDTIDKKIAIIRKMAEGLTYAHKRNVIHRDIKPANIIITNDGDPKITDFGLARLSDSSLTMSGTILGTPNYMSPEQVQGKDVDHRSDFFSLSVVCYEMLTGEKPFSGESITSVIYKVVNEEPAAPREVDDTLPATVDVFMKRALAKNPDQRFQSGEEYINALTAMTRGGTKDIDLLGDSTVVGPKKEDTAKIVISGSSIAGIPKPALIGGGVFVLATILLAILFAGGDKEKDVQASLAPEEKKPAVAALPPDTGEKVTPKDTTKAAPKKPIEAFASQGTITIVSDPKDSEVFIDDKFFGVTPVNNLKIVQGEHTIKVLKKGYTSYEKKIVVGKTEAIKITLAKGSPIKKAIVKKKKPKRKTTVAKITTTRLVVKTPANSMIVIDGRQYKEKNLTLDNLSEGSHMIYVQLKGKKPHTERFTLKKGKIKTIDLR